MVRDLGDSFRIFHIVVKLELSGETQLSALNIINDARVRRVGSGRNPWGLAAAALYITLIQRVEPGKGRRTQKELALAAGVSQKCVRANYKLLWKKLGLTLPDYFEEHYVNRVDMKQKKP